jgi:hypothetical protein
MKMKVPEQKIVSIVKFKNTNDGSPFQTRTIYFQVTIDPDNVSPSEAYIRFGETPGDEIIGWQEVELLEIVETLAVADENGELQPPPRV